MVHEFIAALVVAGFSGADGKVFEEPELIRIRHVFAFASDQIFDSIHWRQLAGRNVLRTSSPDRAHPNRVPSPLAPADKGIVILLRIGACARAGRNNDGDSRNEIQLASKHSRSPLIFGGLSPIMFLHLRPVLSNRDFFSLREVGIVGSSAQLPEKTGALYPIQSPGWLYHLRHL